MKDKGKIEKLLNKLMNQLKRKNCQRALNLADKLLKIDPGHGDVLNIKLIIC